MLENVLVRIHPLSLIFSPKMFIRAPLFVGELDRQLYLYLALIFAGPVYDLVTRRRVHPAYFFALVPCLFFLTGMRLRIGASEWWHQFANSIL